jgi:Group II intron, maturase-specific domain
MTAQFEDQNWKCMATWAFRMTELVPYMRGWRSYFSFCETPRVLVYLTSWVRARLRVALWRQWKTPVVVGQFSWNWAYVQNWRATRPAAAAVPGTSPTPRPYPSRFPRPILNRSVSRIWRMSVSVTISNPCTDPYARWCGRGQRATAAPMPI